MLEKFENEQKIVCKIFQNAVLKKKVGHAYLFETNGYKDKLNIALELSKMLLCPENKVKINCGHCTQCQNIEKNNFSELKIISPDGLWIKKEQLDELQKEFSTSGIQSSRRIYIIEQADRLNKQAANSILKFLEEPEDNITAILITDNMYQMLDTIISRCQIISFKRKKENNLENIQEKIRNNINVKVDDEKLIQIVNDVIEYIIYYEKNGLDTILKNQKLWHNKFKEKEDILLAINIFILIYKDVINLKIKETTVYFNEYITDLETISRLNSIEKINSKIKTLIVAKNKINYNINNNLLIDKLILDLERCG